LSGCRRKVRRVLSDPAATVLVVDRRDRLSRFGVEHLEAALSAAWWAAGGARAGRDGDRVRDMTEALTSECAARVR
jgi:putative resolvase